ncbi:hypothetical protein [Flavobacterium pectinovorum]|uniref:DUF304 domain-containing protein n=2 Tax=Flavobacterium pectinovorum TaxID=29533 RepID=A0ABY1J126_9FLAO|nr:hypothetical protein [Flavobacterium pectinovorum]SHL93063.1 hypothetical protein SAMN05444387_1470 [Flavobacterium pectinovorum]
MNVYTMSHRLKVFIVVFSILLILTFGSLLMVPFITLPPDSLAFQIYVESLSTGYLFYLTPVLSFIMIIFAVLLIINAFNKKVVFTNDAIISKDIFETRKLIFSEIKGFGISNFMLYIETNSNAKKRIAINVLSLNKVDNLMQNLESKFVNLDFLVTEKA